MKLEVASFGLNKFKDRKLLHMRGLMWLVGGKMFCPQVDY